MHYRLNNAQITLPDSWHEQTIYMYSSHPAGQPGQSLSITQEQLEPGRDLAGYKRMFLSKLPDELPGFKLLAEETIYLADKQPAEYVEHVWKADYGLMHHYQALLIRNVPKGILRTANLVGYCLTMSVMEAMHKPTMGDQFKKIAQSFTFER